MSDISPNAPRALRKLFAFANSSTMNKIDWAAGLLALVTGVVLIAVTDEPGVKEYAWLVGGLLGVYFAWQQPMKKLAARASTAIIRKHDKGR